MKNIFRVFLIGMLVVVSACSSSDKKDEEASDTSGEYPIVVKHAYGETTIKKKPERIAALAWASQDSALSLGVSPVYVPLETWGVEDDSKLLPWTRDKIKELDGDPIIVSETDGIDFEAVSDAKPDLILATNSGLTKEDYDTLSEIAPVIAYPDKAWQVSWRDQILLNSKAMGLEKEGKTLVSDLDKMIQKELDRYPEIKGKKTAFLAFGDDDLSTVYMYGTEDSRAAFLEDFGLITADSVVGVTDNESFFGSISAEQAEMLNDVDVIVMYGTDKLVETIKKDPLLGKIKAIENDAIVLLESESPLSASASPSALSIPYAIEDYIKLIGKAAQKVK